MVVDPVDRRVTINMQREVPFEGKVHWDDNFLLQSYYLAAGADFVRIGFDLGPGIPDTGSAWGTYFLDWNSLQ